jgi:hypothetical protein
MQNPGKNQRFVVRALLLAVTAALAACGGGGGGGSSAAGAGATASTLTQVLPPVTSNVTASTPPGTAEGLWQGSDSNNLNTTALVLDNGQTYIFYSAANIPQGFVDGTISSANGVVTSSDAMLFNATPQARLAATLSGSYASDTSLNLTIASPGVAADTFTGKYLAQYDTAASLSSAAGNYTGAGGTRAGMASMTMTVDSAGRINGSVKGTTASTYALNCSFTGSLSPRATQKDVFDTSLTFLGGSCPLGTATVTGESSMVSTTGQSTLYMAALLPDRSDGFVAIPFQPVAATATPTLPGQRL